MSKSNTYFIGAVILAIAAVVGTAFFFNDLISVYGVLPSGNITPLIAFVFYIPSMTCFAYSFDLKNKQ